MKPAVLYARVSSKDQEREGYSIPAQLKTLREYALRCGIKIIREFVDVETAKTAGRKQFGNLHVYKGPEHPHAAQSPTPFDIAKLNPKNSRTA